MRVHDALLWLRLWLLLLLEGLLVVREAQAVGVLSLRGVAIAATDTTAGSRSTPSHHKLTEERTKGRDDKGKGTECKKSAGGRGRGRIERGVR